MKRTLYTISIVLIIAVTFVNCSKEYTTTGTTELFTAVKTAFGSNIDPENLLNYANQLVPGYIRKDNTTPGNSITNTKATLGRVLFYDKNLSIDNTISCASCHQQAIAFTDSAIASKGVVNGLTGRHAMRLVNTRFAAENKFFWDERAATLEQQTTKPMQDHAEMGFSGLSGRPNITALLTKLQGIGYYNELFKWIYGDINVTETRLQECLAQFIRSIQSFDAKYDVGRAQVASDSIDFPNFTAQENAGKALFLSKPIFNATGNRIAGGVGCGGCHRAPEFDIDPNSGNNGIIGSLSSNTPDFSNTRVASLRDVTNSTGIPNSPMMHTGVITTIQKAIGHYGNINANGNNPNLDARLKPNGFGQQLHLTAPEVNSLIAFLNTLTGKNIYTDVKWSNPFK